MPPKLTHDSFQSPRDPIVAAPSRTGARRMADIPATLQNDLDNGSIEAVSLVESLAVDHGKLFHSIAPKAKKSVKSLMDESMSVPITRRIRLGGECLLQQFGLETAVKLFIGHRSDTVRGWVAAIIGTVPDLSLQDRLDFIKVLADDPNAGVREWAWLGLRIEVAAQLDEAIQRLTKWTSDRSPNLRRFASEATRPRGVWCVHIPRLKENPELGMPILEPLASDPAKYVQDSVANWLNDASKTRPEFVRETCHQWLLQSDSKATARICKRATRSIDRPK